jgi:hypothetical protein
MNTEKYLAQLKAELNDFNPEERDLLIEEVAAHIEDGLGDYQMGNDFVERGQKLDAEMGSPHDLGRGLNEIHQPNRWVDFLLVFVPYEILKYPILIILTMIFGGLARTNSSLFSEPYWMANIRIFFLIYGLLVLIALRKRSLAVLFFWLPQTIGITFTLIFREKRWLHESPFNQNQAGIFESVFWFILLFSLVFWLAYLLWVNRENVLQIVLAFLPFLVAIGNMTQTQYIERGYFSGGYQLPDWNLATIGGLPIGVYQLSMLIWPILFYISRHRPVQWLGLLLYVTPLALMNFLASTRFPQLAALWIFPIALVLIGWLIDQKAHRHQNDLHIA